MAVCAATMCTMESGIEQGYHHANGHYDWYGYGYGLQYAGYNMNAWTAAMDSPTSNWNVEYESSRTRSNSRRKSKALEIKVPEKQDEVPTPKTHETLLIWNSETPEMAADSDDHSHDEPTVDPKVLCSSLTAVYRSLVNMAKQKGTHEKEKLTRFHSKVEPSVGVEPYIQRMWQYFNCSESCHVMALVYIDRVVKLNPEFVVSNLTIHRLLAVATLVSAKFSDDVYFSNAYYAKVCGLSLQELNRLEGCFLQMIKWKLSVPNTEYHAYLAQVLKASGKCA
eukprot:TRINITY_DN108474_c0_g1_i1.p1 TRINITY_DN108474_c0_g1~~TRINITY_DN108474_c0_g1_i1.p1  ORF type:complete len:280 (-),score=69.50 TRINITY_DN108474_c0_g1_i1:60-899(-)